VELHVFEHKGSGDLEAFERIAHSYGSGVDDETIAAAAATLSWLVEEVGRRAEKIKELRKRSRALVPDSRTTRELANRRALGLHPVVFVDDECQELFSHPKYGKQAGEDAEKVIRRGRAFGVHLILATQRPDKDSLPTGVSANVGTRFCMRVKGQVENDMILGTSAYKNGIRATMLRLSDRGIGYLDGALDHPTIVRTYYLDGEATETVVARAYEAREAAGLLSGQAAGEVVDHGQAVDFLDDVRTVMGHIEKLWSEDLLARLAEHRPQVYGAWVPQQLAAAFKPHAITPGDQKIDGVNRNGYRLSWVLEALANRELER
jgi:S-DNA-T family DNA segregation ATPase FtsK/SpoIIIE